ncbi:toprim domain-containing protein [Novosphingobium meiothermophilum]|uniref:toprim domain-containing protein n=1 Tax=Novosphingobium meiothermophilum TaxID=2202251 RepID=UPI000D6E707B|nr:toprim domain-containing protein [Novosphingobium meiothermophilum]
MSHETESALLYKGPCEHCGSSDARAVYDDGHSYCYACPEETAWQAGEGGRSGPSQGSVSPLPRELLRGDHAPLGKRKLTLKTVQQYDYRIGQQHGESVQIAPYHDASGRVVAQKIRPRDKDGIHWVGKKKGILPLFGQSKFKAGGRMVVVTEGELDAMSQAQAMGNTWPVVSVPDGAASAHKAIAEAAHWLEQFERVVFMFDMDDPGQEAAVKCAALITPGKAYIADLPLKDASDMLQAGREREMVTAAWQARQYRPDGILEVSSLREKAIRPPEYGLPFPFPTLTKATYGIRRGELYGYGAGVGSGKTTLFKQLMLCTMFPDMIEPHDGIPIIAPEPRRVGALLLEENPVKTIRTLAGMRIGARVHVPGVDFDGERLAEAIDEMDGLFFPYNHFGAKDWSSIKERIRYMVLGLGIKDIFLDHLTALIAQEDDDRKALDVIMSDLASMVEQHHFTLHFISHLTTPTGTAHEEGGRVLEKHFTGSRAIARWSHNLFALERNKQEPGKPTTFRILKERETGDATGVTFGLAYDRETGRLVEADLEENTHGFRDEGAGQDF